MNSILIYVILAGGTCMLAAIGWFMSFVIRVSVRRRRMKSYNLYVKEQYAERGQQTPSLILRIQNEYIECYNKITEKPLGSLFQLHKCPLSTGLVGEKVGSKEALELPVSEMDQSIVDALNKEIEPMSWRGTANIIIGWFGVIFVGMLLALTAGVDLYQKHFELFVAVVIAIPLFFIINKRANRWAKKVEVERLRVVSGFEVSEGSALDYKKSSHAVPSPVIVSVSRKYAPFYKAEQQQTKSYSFAHNSSPISQMGKPMHRLAHHSQNSPFLRKNKRA